jgi:hypothetical protein
MYHDPPKEWTSAASAPFPVYTDDEERWCNKNRSLLPCAQYVVTGGLYNALQVASCHRNEHRNGITGLLSGYIAKYPVAMSGYGCDVSPWSTAGISAGGQSGWYIDYNPMKMRCSAGTFKIQFSTQSCDWFGTSILSAQKSRRYFKDRYIIPDVRSFIMNDVRLPNLRVGIAASVFGNSVQSFTTRLNVL